VLERALKVQIQRVPQLPGGDSRHSAMAVVVIANVTALHNARKDLKNLNENLERQVRERTTALLRAVARLKRENEQRKAAELDLQESRDELAQLSQQLMHAQETERSRLSRELHDSVGQSLGAIKYTLERLAAAHSHGTDDDADRILSRAITGVAEAIRDMRSIAMRLRPPILDDMGAAAAVQWLVRGFSQTYPDIQFHLETSVSNEDIPLQLSTHIYRIAQEALNNAVKHAQPESVLVSICQKSTQLALEIIDDGVGFQMNASDTGQFRRLGHFGHLGMRERVSNSNGIISIRSAPGQGTKVKVEWDLNTDSSVKEQIA
jgi:signal transduction histidine kinase